MWATTATIWICHGTITTNKSCRTVNIKSNLWNQHVVALHQVSNFKIISDISDIWHPVHFQPRAQILIGYGVNLTRWLLMWAWATSAMMWIFHGHGTTRFCRTVNIGSGLWNRREGRLAIVIIWRMFHGGIITRSCRTVNVTSNLWNQHVLVTCSSTGTGTSPNFKVQYR